MTEGTDIVEGSLQENQGADEAYKTARRQISDIIHNAVEDKIDALDLLARVDHSLRTVSEFNQADGDKILEAFGVGLSAFLEAPGTRDSPRRTRR